MERIHDHSRTKIILTVFVWFIPEISAQIQLWMTNAHELSESWRTATLGNKIASCYIISTELKLTLMN